MNILTSSSEALILFVAIALTLCGVLCQIRSWALVSRESKLIRILSRRWPETSKADWRRDPVALLHQYGIPDYSLTAKHVMLARSSFGAQSPSSASDLIAVSEDSIRSRISHTVPNALLSILLIAGLAGTIFILREVLQAPQFEQIITADAKLNTERLQNAVKWIYGGFGYAFISSLCGIAGTIVLISCRALLVRPAELRFFSELQRLTVENLQPTFEREEVTLPEALERAAKSSEITSQQFSEGVQRLSHTLDSATSATRELDENVSKLSGFASIMGNAGKALERATVALDEAFSEGGRLSKVFGHQSESVGELSHIIHEAAGDLRTHSDQIRNAQQWLEHIGRLIEADVKASEQYRAQQTSAIESVRALSEKADVIASRVNNLTERVEAIGKQNVSGALAGISNDVAALQRELKQSSKEHGETKELFLKKLEEVVKKGSVQPTGRPTVPTETKAPSYQVGLRPPESSLNGPTLSPSPQGRIGSLPTQEGNRRPNATPQSATPEPVRLSRSGTSGPTVSSGPGANIVSKEDNEIEQPPRTDRSWLSRVGSSIRRRFSG